MAEIRGEDPAVLNHFFARNAKGEAYPFSLMREGAKYGVKFFKYV